MESVASLQKLNLDITSLDEEETRVTRPAGFGGSDGGDTADDVTDADDMAEYGREGT